MVAIPLESPPWARQASPTEAIRSSHASEAPRCANPRTLLDSAINKTRALLEASRSTIEKHEAIYDAKVDHLEADELKSFSDEAVLDYMYQFGFCAEITHEWSEGMKSEADALRAWRDSTGCWSEEADHILSELDRLAAVFADTNQCFHKWADQLSDEYEHRHPDLAELPLQPLDLGPTNAARLPRVL